MKWSRLLFLGVVAVLLALRGPARAGDEVPDDVRKILQDYEKEAADIQKKADEAIKLKKDKLLKTLKDLQDAYCRATKLEEAIAIRNKIRELKGIALNVQADPGRLTGFRDQIGKSFYFEVTGATIGAIWGTDVYTDDSQLAIVAVHAGVLKEGQKAIVKVTIIKHEGTYDSATRNGVTSNAYGPYNGSSYKVEALKD